MDATQHGNEPRIPFEAEAYQAFVMGLKRFWSASLYDRVAGEAAALGPSGAKEIEKTLARDMNYQLFGWLEHYLQQFKYLGRWGLLSVLEDQEPALAQILAASAKEAPERLRLDPDLALPDYYCVGDFHQHPGGVWSDAHDAFAYEWGATMTTPLAADHTDLHDRFAARVKALVDPKSVLDQGCGFGKTTLALKKLMSAADVIGCDVAAPCLALGHKRALEAGLNIRFDQCAVEDLAFEAAQFELVAGSMLLHEMPPSAIRRSFREARRVLKPGGLYAHLDFYIVPGGEVGRFFHNGHSARNREPFMVSLCKMDLAAELAAAGFEDIRIEPFEEDIGALAKGDDLPERWRFPWTTIIARAAA